MTRPEVDSELKARWCEWLLRRNRSGMRSVLWIVLCLYPAFGVLDFLVAPERWLPWLYATRALVTLVTLALFPVIRSEAFRRFPDLISATYMLLISIGISLMTVFMGGLASPYYAGLALVMVASGLLFVWPPHVVALTHAGIVLGFLAQNLAVNAAPDVLAAISNQFFLISTAIIAGTGQMLAFRSQREQLNAELAREAAARSLEHAHQRLERLDRFKSEFFANITHELKTPLTLILAPLGLMLDGQLGAMSAAQASTLTAMQRSGVKLSRLIGDLLDLSKLEESRLRLRVERHDLVDMLSTRRYGGAGIGLALAKELVELHGGRIWARGAAGAGATFSVRLLVDREHFDPDVFDWRSSVDARINAQRQRDQGLSQWELDTPEHLRLIDIDEATEQRRVERDDDEHRREHSVLVVEDTPEVARLIHLALQSEYRILIARDGEQGLELARRHRPSIIITDWMMAKLDGLELTRQLREDPQTRHVPIVMLTAKSDLDDKLRGLETGVSAYLGKPFAASEIVSTVRSLLRTQGATADALLAQKLDSLELIAGGLAHEILNPLNYLKNALTIAQNDSQSLALAVRSAASGLPESGIVRRIDRMQEMFEVSRAGVKRIAGTVDLMVRYSRDGHARIPSLYDAYAAARDVAAVVGPSVARDVPITLDLVGDGKIDCVAEEFNQVLSNLIQNALEAAPGDGSGRVVIQGRNEGAELRLSVKDNGLGIPESERSRVFDAFYTTKQARHGMGLGLTITRRVIVGLGGSLKVESELGKGSEFIIRVPSSVGCREAAS